ncbi:MAG: DUF4097 family beta strand repeat-containing protein [Oscillospiraceae bacterium]|nr:DUF4097 family beta strand repeat-containing protein [Oscillospiraceae bacterium]
MRKYLEELRGALGSRQQESAARELLEDLETHFAEARRSGQKEEDVCAALGEPAEIAAQFQAFASEEPGAEQPGAGSDSVGDDFPAGGEVLISLRAYHLYLASGGDTFEVSVRQNGAWVEDSDVCVERAGNSLRVSQTSERGWRFWFLPDRRSRDVFVTLPRWFRGDVSLELQAGNTRVRNLELDGALRLESRAGNAKLERVRAGGGIGMKNLSGNMNVIDCAGDLRVENKSGNIHVRRQGGKVEVANTSGNCHVEAGHMDWESRVETMSGTVNLEADVLAAPIDLSCTSGVIRFEIRRLAANLTARVTSGAIQGDLGADTQAVFQTANSFGFRNDFAGVPLTQSGLPVVTLSCLSGIMRVRRMA